MAEQTTRRQFGVGSIELRPADGGVFLIRAELNVPGMKGREAEAWLRRVLLLGASAVEAEADQANGVRARAEQLKELSAC